MSDVQDGSTKTHPAFALASLLCVLPLLVAHYPAMVDLPQHAGQIAGIRGILDGSWRYASLFEIRAFTPYWLGYGLVLLLSYAVGVPVALKVVIGAAVAAFPWSIARFLSRYAVPAGWFGWLLPLSLGFAFQWGFLSFIVAMPLAFLFLARWSEVSEKQGWRDSLTIALWVHVLFFAHLLIAAFVLAVAALQVLASPVDTRTKLRRVAPLVSVIPLAALWLWLTLHSSAQAHEPIVWKVGIGRLPGLLGDWIGAPQSSAAPVLGLCAAAFPWIAGWRWRREPARWLPFAFYVAFVLFFPLYLAGNAYTASRFAVFGIPLYFVCFQPKGEQANEVRQPRWGLITGLLGLSLVGWHCLRASIFDLEIKGYRDVIAATQPGRRVLSLMIEPRGYGSSTPYFLHAPAWYQAEKAGLVEPSFAGSYAIPLQYRDVIPNGVDLAFVWAPTQFDWQRNQGAAYDYFVVRSVDDPRRWYAPGTRCHLMLSRRSGAWWLFTKAEPASCPAYADG